MTGKLSEIQVKEGLELVNNGIERLKRVAEEPSLRPPFSSEEYSLLCSTIFNLCITDIECCRQLYDLHKQVLVDFINSMVLHPVDELSLEELVNIWSRYKQMAKWLLHLFGYLDRVYVVWRNRPKLNEVALACFRDLVFLETSSRVEAAAIELIAVEREGGKVDGALLRGVVDMCVQIGMEKMDDYEDTFEKHILEKQALKEEAFGIVLSKGVASVEPPFLNKEVGGRSSVDRQTTSCDSVLKKDGPGRSRHKEAMMTQLESCRWLILGAVTAILSGLVVMANVWEWKV